MSEAIGHLETAVRVNRLALDARHLLMQLYAARKDWPAFERMAQETLQLAPADESAQRLLASRGNDGHLPEEHAKPQDLLNLSLEYYRSGRYEDCIAAARKALDLEPDYAEAYNNIAAASNSLARWDEGIQAASQALRIRPDFELAKNNMMWAISQKQKTQGRK